MKEEKQPAGTSFSIKFYKTKHRNRRAPASTLIIPTENSTQCLFTVTAEPRVTQRVVIATPSGGLWEQMAGFHWQQNSPTAESSNKLSNGVTDRQTVAVVLLNRAQQPRPPSATPTSQSHGHIPLWLQTKKQETLRSTAGSEAERRRVRTCGRDF